LTLFDFHFRPFLPFRQKQKTGIFPKKTGGIGVLLIYCLFFLLYADFLWILQKQFPHGEEYAILFKKLTNKVILFLVF